MCRNALLMAEVTIPHTPSMSAAGRRVYVGNLAWRTDHQNLRDAFSSHGHIIEAYVIVDHFTGYSRGFGFVRFAKASYAKKALENMSGSTLHGRKIRVEYATSQY